MAFKAGAIVGEAKLDTTKWNSSLKSLGKTTGIAAAAIGAAFDAVMVKSIKAADEFQKSMSNVKIGLWRRRKAMPPISK